MCRLFHRKKSRQDETTPELAPEPSGDGDWYPDDTRDRPSARDILKRDDIDVDKMCEALGLPRENVELADVKNSRSMDAMFDVEHNCILVKMGDVAPYRCQDLEVGDVAVYQIGTKLTVHRIIKIGEDEHGRWYKFRGDNTSAPDPDVLRDQHIKYLLVGIIY